MTDYDEMMLKLSTAAAEELRPLIAEAAEVLAVREEDMPDLGGFLTKAWMDGAMAGQEAMVAQAAEQGFAVENRMLRAPRSEETEDRG
jgi:hypothetical protein